jgi:Protein of unknown function (DUF2958)
MKLLTKEIAQKMPKLYSTENVETMDKTIIVKFFTPDSSWTWYAVEANAYDEGTEDYTKPLTEWSEGEDVLFFGLVDGFEQEWGNWTLMEMAGARGPMGLAIERDMHFGNKKVSELA